MMLVGCILQFMVKLESLLRMRVRNLQNAQTTMSSLRLVQRRGPQALMYMEMLPMMSGHFY